MKKTKFTIIDAVIIIVILAMLVVGIKVLGGNLGSGGEKKEVYFTVLIDNVDEGTADIINKGEKVSISFSEEAYATVVDASEEPYERSEYSEAKGCYMTHAVEGKSSVKVLLKCDADVSETKISNGNVAIRVGEEMAACGKGYRLKGYVIEVEEK